MIRTAADITLLILHVVTESKGETECCMLDVIVIISNNTFVAGFKTKQAKSYVLSWEHFSPLTGHMRLFRILLQLICFLRCTTASTSLCAPRSVRQQSVS